MEEIIKKVYEAVEKFSMEFEKTHWVKKLDEEDPETKLYRACGKLKNIIENELTEEDEFNTLLKDLALENMECY